MSAVDRAVSLKSKTRHTAVVGRRRQKRSILREVIGESKTPGGKSRISGGRRSLKEIPKWKMEKGKETVTVWREGPSEAVAFAPPTLIRAPISCAQFHRSAH
ncbi:hypothetical protein ACFX10_017424 [Malus domestica]